MKTRIMLVLSLILISQYGDDFGHARSKSNISIDKGEAIVLGKGIDIVSGTIKNDCVNRDNIERSTTGKVAEFYLTKISDYESLAREMNISASASLSKIASGKAKFVNNQSVSQYSLYVLAKVTVSLFPEVLRDVKLKPEFEQILDNQGPEKFRQICGDEFIYSLTKGGEFYALLVINTKSQTELEETSAALKGSYGMFSAAGEFNSRLEKLSKHYDMNVYQYIEGPVTTALKIDPEELIKSAADFAGSVDSTNAYPYSADTSTYDIAIFQSSKSPIDISNQNDVIEEMSSLRYGYLKQIADIDYVINNPTEFINPALDTLSRTRTAMYDNLNKIYKNASDCFKDFKNCSFPTDLTDIKYQLPERVQSPSDPKNLCYKCRADVLCGVKRYKKQRDPKCGVELYKEGSGPVCGVKEYAEGRGPECGVELYKQRRDPSCGVETRETMTIESGPNCPDKTNEGWTLVSRGCYGQTPEGDGRGGHGQRPGKTCNCNYERLTYKICRKIEFGVERYNKCRNPSFGVSSYNKCRSEQFGVELYRECEDMTFGIDEYNKCRRIEFGIDETVSEGQDCPECEK